MKPIESNVQESSQLILRTSPKKCCNPALAKYSAVAWSMFTICLVSMSLTTGLASALINKRVPPQHLPWAIAGVSFFGAMTIITVIVVLVFSDVYLRHTRQHPARLPFSNSVNYTQL